MTLIEPDITEPLLGEAAEKGPCDAGNLQQSDAKCAGIYLLVVSAL
jgi:hypothetical protein